MDKVKPHELLDDDDGGGDASSVEFDCIELVEVDRLARRPVARPI